MSVERLTLVEEARQLATAALLVERSGGLPNFVLKICNALEASERKLSEIKLAHANHISEWQRALGDEQTAHALLKASCVELSYQLEQAHLEARVSEVVGDVFVKLRDLGR